MPAPLRSSSARAAAVGLTPAPAASAQPLADDSTAAAVLARIAPGEVVRVRGAGATTLEGTLAGVGDVYALVTAGGRARAIRLEDVRGVWTRGRTGRRGGARGAGLGALAGLAVAGLVRSATADDDGDGGSGIAAAGAFLGGLVGFVSGPWLADRGHGWRQAYPLRGPAGDGNAGMSSSPARVRDGRIAPPAAPAWDAVPRLRAVGGL